MNWDDLKVVLAAARNESVAGAARQLGVDETTVARRLRRVEQTLGARLFERTQGCLSPSAAGQRLLATAERVELEVQTGEASIVGQDRRVAGTVRLTAVPLLVNRLLVPALPRLAKRHPQLRLELVAEPRDLSLTKREADLALRFARPRSEQSAVARRVGHLSYGVYGLGTADPETLPWLGYEEAMVDLPPARWLAARCADDKELSASLAVNDAEALFAAVAAGLGKSLLPVALAEQVSGLRRLDKGSPPLSRELWLLVHPDLRHLGRIRTVIDWLLETAGSLDRLQISR